MKVKIDILGMLLWLCVMPTVAGGRAERPKGSEAERLQAERLSPERMAQFYYDFYAAQQAMNDGHYAQAYCLFKLCEQVNPRDARTQDYLGMIYDALHLKDSAYAAFARAYQYAPDDAYQHYAGSLLEKKRYQEAFSVFKSAVKTNGDDLDTWHMLLQMAITNEDYRTATKAINRIDELIGPSAYSAMIRYQIALQQKKIKQAILHLETYFEYVPDNPTMLNDYAYLLATHRGDLNKAEQMSAQATRLQPDNPSFLDTYGWILHLKGNDSLAQFYLRKALNLSNDPKEKNLILQHLEKTK